MMLSSKYNFKEIQTCNEKFYFPFESLKYKNTKYHINDVYLIGNVDNYRIFM